MRYATFAIVSVLLCGCTSPLTDALQAREQVRRETLDQIAQLQTDAKAQQVAIDDKSLPDSDRQLAAARELFDLKQSSELLASIRASARVTYDSSGTGTPLADGVTVYSAAECVGAIVAGQCHGSISPQTAYHATCHGQMLNGRCTGPMF